MACSTAKASCKQLLTNNCDTETETRRQTDRQRLFRTAVPAVKEKLVLKWMMAAYLAKQESAAWSTPDCSARTQTCAVLSSAPPPDACMNICHIDLPGVRYSCSELIVRHLSLQPHAHWRDARQIMWVLSGMLSMQTCRQNDPMASSVCCEPYALGSAPALI